ncbi:uncharacterized protein C16orf78 homolog [Orycteropus afer afer]|uniref:Uncharacterized protein C16orf78 homolog n=1 Tax=Orycteropus afer afer TaxID=1230840 RepID=A0A8B7ADI8_ORYAF|nr:uncharacterized protein C16orf78 homolog [Orycteropus afer afer]
MSEKAEDLKDMMPTEHKSMWKTAEERRMSDLTRVLEWMERRQGKKKQVLQKNKPKEVATVPKTSGTEEKKKGILKQHQGGKHQVLFPGQVSQQSSRKDRDLVTYRRLYGIEPKGKRLSMVLGNYAKNGSKKPDLDKKDAMAMESSPRGGTHRQQSSLDPVFQDSLFPPRRSTLMREWPTKMPDTSYERKLKSLMEKGTEPKMETVKMLKPEEVLSCRYLRLSKNNIKTLLKLCKDAGMNVDIHPHMVEGDIDANMVFAHTLTTAL